MTTLSDIAKALGISKSTVSKALRSSSDISPETCARVRKAALELGYNLQLAHAKLGKTIALICPELGSPYYDSIQQALRVRARKLGYELVIMLTDFDSEREISAFKSLSTENLVEGICILTENSSHFNSIHAISERCGVKLVMIAAGDEIDFCDSIGVNHPLGAALAVDHLISLGHRKIAYIGEQNSMTRELSFRATMRSHRLTLPAGYLLRRTDRFEECGFGGMKRLLELDEPPTAVFAAYDSIAYGAMRAIRESGLRIPDDISIIGIDASPTSRFTAPPLTSVFYPTEEIGTLAADLLDERIRNGSRTAFRSIKLLPKLSLGCTTKCNEKGVTS